MAIGLPPPFPCLSKKEDGIEQFLYFAVPEPHQDDYPHIHLIVAFPFVKVEQIYKWWKDTRTGKSLSAFQGVDVQFIGRDEDVNFLGP